MSSTGDKDTGLGERIFGHYQDKSKGFQKYLAIYLGFALFFFFAGILTYIMLQYEQYDMLNDRDDDLMTIDELESNLADFQKRQVGLKTFSDGRLTYELYDESTKNKYSLQLSEMVNVGAIVNGSQFLDYKVFGSNVYVVWEETDDTTTADTEIFFTASTDNGTKFGEPIPQIIS